MISKPSDLLSTLVGDMPISEANLGPLLIIAEEFSEMLEEVYDAAIDADVGIDDAEGVVLEARTGIAGNLRLMGAPAGAIVTFTGDPGTPIPAGTRVATIESIEIPAQFSGTTGADPDSGVSTHDRLLGEAVPKDSYTTDEAVTLRRVRAVKSGDTVVAGEIVTYTNTAVPPDSGFGKNYGQWVIEITSVGATDDFDNMDGSSLFSIPGDDISADASDIDFKCLGRGTAIAEVAVTSVEPLEFGPVQGVLAELGSNNGYTDVRSMLRGIVLVEDPIPGVLGVINREAGTDGRTVEDDINLRRRALRAGAAAAGLGSNHGVGDHDGTTTDGLGAAIDATLRRIPGVLWSKTNVDFTDNSITVNVIGGRDDYVAEALYKAAPTALTINAGNTDVEVLGRDGRVRTISFNRPAINTISEVTATLVVDPDEYPGELYVLESVHALSLIPDVPVPNQASASDRRRELSEVEHRPIFGVGDSVYDSQVQNAMLNVPGVLSVTDVALDGTALVTVSDQEYVQFDVVTLIIREI